MALIRWTQERIIRACIGDVPFLRFSTAIAAIAAEAFVFLAKIVQDVPPQAALGFAVVHHDVQPLQIQPLLLLQLLLGKLPGKGGVLDQVFGGLHIPRGIEQDALGLCAVPPGAACLLVVAFQALGHIVVNDVGHVGLVDAHAEGVGGHHDGLPVVEEILLVIPALLIGQTCVVPGGGNAVQLQILADLLHGLPGSAVDNASLVPALLHQLSKGGPLLSWAAGPRSADWAGQSL